MVYTTYTKKSVYPPRGRNGIRSPSSTEAIRRLKALREGPRPSRRGHHPFHLLPPARKPPCHPPNHRPPIPGRRRANLRRRPGVPPTTASHPLFIAGLKAFNEKPAMDPAAYYSRDYDSGVNFNSNVDLLKSRAASWRDTLQVMTAPRGADWTHVPDECREAMMEWDLRVVSLADELMRLLCDGLGVGRDRLKEMSCLEARLMAGHYYPYCPETDRTLGIKSHSDPGVLTVLLQNQVEGLQVKFRDEWIEVTPLEDALVINIADLLQIMSNDEYKSVEHRVVANSHYESRISVAIFCNPSKRGDGDFFGPLPELITPDKPASYRNFIVPELQFFGSELGGHVKHFRLIEKDDGL